MVTKKGFYQKIPVCVFLFILGCAPKAAVSTRVHANEEPQQQAASPTNETQPASSDEVFMFVEQSPQFPGGDRAMLDFIKRNIVYPADARENGQSGKVMVQFVVMKDGSLKDAKVARGVSESLDKEALRVVSLMPRWIPGKQNGQAVNVRYMLPISFVLE